MNKRRLTFALCCMVTVVTAMAQSTTISREIYSLVGYCGENVAAEIYHSPKRTSYSKCYRFDLPNNKKNTKVLQNLTAQFRGRINDAYQFRELKAGMSPGNPQRVVYGDKNEFYIDFFKYLNHNTTVMLVKDSTDVSKRYGYALDWYKAGKRLVGKVYIIYGKDPQYVAAAPTVRVMQQTQDVTSDVIPGIKISENGRVTIGIATATGSEDAVMISMNDSIVTELDFLKQFGNLRGTILVQKGNRQIVGSLAYKLLELCKNYAYLLEKETRVVCMDEIERMVKGEFVKDPYIKSILSLAYKSLLKAEKPKK